MSAPASGQGAHLETTVLSPPPPREVPRATVPPMHALSAAHGAPATSQPVFPSPETAAALVAAVAAVDNAVERSRALVVDTAGARLEIGWAGAKVALATAALEGAGKAGV